MGEEDQKTIRGIVFPTNAPEGAPLRFSSTILPPYLRRAKSIEELLPWLYPKAVPAFVESTGIPTGLGL